MPDNIREDAITPPPHDPPPAPAAQPQQERPAPQKTGEVLRAARVAKRITIESVARDLRLNARYITAIEESDYASLPGDPYIRVYLRAIGRYLGLDPEDVLRRFLKERGIDMDEIKAATTKIPISVEKDERPRIPWTVIAALVGVLVVVGIIGSRMSLNSQQQPVKSRHSRAEPAARTDTAAVDSVQAERFKPLDLDSTARTAARRDTGAAKKTDSLTLVVTAAKDSVWVQAYADGAPWRGTLTPGIPRTLTARDSLNVRVGKNPSLSYVLNGKPVDNTAVAAIKGADIIAFKIDRTGITPWNTQKWISVFKQ